MGQKIRQASFMRAATCAMLVLSLSACAAINSIHWSYPGPAGSRVITVDAKQRHLIMVKEDKKLKVCAEAAPDIFSAINSSLGADATFGGAEQKAKAAVAIAEAASTIERTQTVNLLRESMYRTCERFLSGALSNEQLIIQAARDQQTMLAILAIEQLTGAVKGPATIIAAPTTTAGIGAGEAMANLINDLNKANTTAKTNQAAAKDALAAADVKGKCVGSDTKPDGVSVEDYATCTAAKQLKADRDTEAKSAGDRLDKALAAANVQGGIGSGTGTFDPQPGEAWSPDADLIEAVADAVEAIATRPAIDETLMFCVAYLTRAANQQVASTIDLCNSVIERSAAIENSAKIRLFQIQGVSPDLREINNDKFAMKSFRQRLVNEMSKLAEPDALRLLRNFEREIGVSDETLSLNRVCGTKTRCIADVVGGFFDGRYGPGYDDALNKALMAKEEKSP